MVKDIDYTHKLSEYDRWFMWQIFQRIDDDVELYNFIARHFNSVRPKEVRRAKIAEWENLLKYWINLSERLNSFEKSIIIDYYFGELEMHEYTSKKNPTVEYDALFSKTLGIIKNIDGTEDIIPIKQENVVVVAPDNYNETEFPYVPYSEIRRTKKADNYNEFSKLPEDVQQSIVDFYFMYDEALTKAEEEYYDIDLMDINSASDNQHFFEDNEDFIFSKAKAEAVIDALIKKYFFRFRDSSILKKYENFFRENELTELVETNFEDIDKYIGVETNLIITSYFLHYVLRSMGVKTNDGMLKTKIHKIDRSNVNAVQRFLCAITTKQVQKLEDFSNSYYKSFNQLFKFDSENEVEKEKILKHLITTQELLLKYGFDGAVKLLKQDYDTISKVQFTPKKYR